MVNFKSSHLLIFQSNVQYLIFITSLGWMGIAVMASGLRRVVLPRSLILEVEEALGLRKPDTGYRIQDIENRIQNTGFMGQETGLWTQDSRLKTLDYRLHTPDLYDLADRIRRYLEGQKVFFPDKVDLAGATAFQEEVWLALRDIPYGQRISYGEMANRLGKPGVSRAIGQALSRNPLPIILPCHRVISQSGRLAGYSGGVELKKLLLEIENGPLNLKSRLKWKNSKFGLPGTKQIQNSNA